VKETEIGREIRKEERESNTDKNNFGNEDK
jgi:hypothetical protein